MSYRYDVDRFSGVTLFETPTGNTVYLQPGDEANNFLDTINEVWDMYSDERLDMWIEYHISQYFQPSAVDAE